jgi:hypothetical protein
VDKKAPSATLIDKWNTFKGFRERKRAVNTAAFGAGSRELFETTNPMEMFDVLTVRDQAYCMD